MCFSALGAEGMEWGDSGYWKTCRGDKKGGGRDKGGETLWDYERLLPQRSRVPMQERSVANNREMERKVGVHGCGRLHPPVCGDICSNEGGFAGGGKEAQQKLAEECFTFLQQRGLTQGGFVVVSGHLKTKRGGGEDNANYYDGVTCRDAFDYL
jgi:hypothetical protein